MATVVGLPFGTLLPCVSLERERLRLLEAAFGTSRYTLRLLERVRLRRLDTTDRTDRSPSGLLWPRILGLLESGSALA